MLQRWWALQVLESQGAVFLTAWCVWIVVSITLHELAHGWSAVRRGDRTPIDLDRLTFNPLVHMGGMSLLMFALCGIAWGAMPVDATRLKGRYAEAWVAFAGPLMNFGLALLCVVLAGALRGLQDLGVLSATDKVPGHLVEFFFVGGALNIGLGLFNLIPIMPLDGGRIAGNFFRGYERFGETQGGQFMSTACFIIAFFFAGRIIFTAGFYGTAYGMGLVRLPFSLFGGGVGAP